LTKNTPFLEKRQFFLIFQYFSHGFPSAYFTHDTSINNVEHTGKNREKIFLKICVFLQTSEKNSQNEQFFLKLSDYQTISEKFAHFENNFRILEKNTNFEKNVLTIFPSAELSVT
jgi:hypothetical protein